MKILRYASAIWNGPVPTGTGSMSLGRNQVTTIPFSLKSRTEENAGTNPEEMLGAAHAGCFSMALTSILEDAGLNVGSIETSAKVTLEQKSDGFYITEIHLIARGKNQACTNEEFVSYAERAKKTCPVSKLFASAEITLDAALA